MSSLIRRVTSGGYSHVGIAWAFDGRLFVLEARELRGVTIRAASNALPFVHVATGAAWTPRTRRRALAELGKPYSYLDAVRAGLRRPMRNRAAICSAYARERLRDCGLPVPTHVQHPSDLVEWVQDHASQPTWSVR